MHVRIFEDPYLEVGYRIATFERYNVARYYLYTVYSSCHLACVLHHGCGVLLTFIRTATELLGINLFSHTAW